MANFEWLEARNWPWWFRMILTIGAIALVMALINEFF